MRLIQQLRELSPSPRRAIFRWLSFRNVFTVIANISFVFAFIIQLCAQYSTSSEEVSKFHTLEKSIDTFVYIIATCYVLVVKRYNQRIKCIAGYF